MNCLVPDHSDHLTPERPRVARYSAVLLLVLLAAITLRPFVDHMVIGRPRPVQPRHLKRSELQPGSRCSASQNGRFFFIENTPSAAARRAATCGEHRPMLVGV